MMFSPAALFMVLCALALSPSGSSASAVIRGLNPDLAARYNGEGGVFTCLDASKKIPFSRVNDDYCDCSDGSDEPGTAACHNGRFYCRNLGHEPKLLGSSFVDDGVCDCCDGSDEVRGKCKNTCLEASAVRREGLKAEIAQYEQSLAVKQGYITKAAEFKHALSSKVGTIDTEIANQHAEVEQLRAEKDLAEEEERRVREAEEQQRQKEDEERRKQEEEAAAAEQQQQQADQQAEQQPEGAVAGEEEGAAHERELMAEEPHAEEQREETPEERGRRIASQWTTDPEAAGEAYLKSARGNRCLALGVADLSDALKPAVRSLAGGDAHYLPASNFVVACMQHDAEAAAAAVEPEEHHEEYEPHTEAEYDGSDVDNGEYDHQHHSHDDHSYRPGEGEDEVDPAALKAAMAWADDDAVQRALEEMQTVTEEEAKQAAAQVAAEEEQHYRERNEWEEFMMFIRTITGVFGGLGRKLVNLFKNGIRDDIAARKQCSASRRFDNMQEKIEKEKLWWQKLVDDARGEEQQQQQLEPSKQPEQQQQEEQAEAAQQQPKATQRARRGPGAKPPRSDASTPAGEARARLHDAEQVLARLEQTKQDIELYLRPNMDFGPEDVFLGLAKGEPCFSSYQTRWTYEACLFKEATQSEGGNNKVVVGRWQGFHVDGDNVLLVYGNGDMCQGVGPRSFTVALSCASFNRLYDAEEPKTCGYTAKMSTPAACSSAELDRLKDHLRHMEEAEREIAERIAKDEL